MFLQRKSEQSYHHSWARGTHPAVLPPKEQPNPYMQHAGSMHNAYHRNNGAYQTGAAAGYTQRGYCPPSSNGNLPQPPMALPLMQVCGFPASGAFNIDAAQSGYGTRPSEPWGHYDAPSPCPASNSGYSWQQSYSGYGAWPAEPGGHTYYPSVMHSYPGQSTYDACSPYICNSGYGQQQACGNDAPNSAQFGYGTRPAEPWGRSSQGEMRNHYRQTGNDARAPYRASSNSGYNQLQAYSNGQHWQRPM